MMPSDKFKAGDMVVMTLETYEMNRTARSHTGVVVGESRLPHCIRVQRDGQKTIDIWHESAWQLKVEEPPHE
jgi:hypothetical protein